MAITKHLRLGMLSGKMLICFIVLEVQSHGTGFCPALVRNFWLHHHTADGIMVGVCVRGTAMGREEARDVLGQVCSFRTSSSYGKQPGSSENYIVLSGHQCPNDLVTFSSVLPLKDSTPHWD